MKKLFNRNFCLLGGGSLVSSFGDALFSIALSFAVFRMTGSTALLSVVMIMQIIPTVLFGFFAGVVVDWHSKKNVMIAMDIFRGVAVTLFGVLFLFGVKNIPLILVCCAVISSCGAFYMPASDCAVPRIVGGENMVNATSALISIQEIADLVGKSAGGFLLAICGAPLLFILDGLTFIISGVCAVLMRFSEAEREKAGAFDMKFIRDEISATKNYISGHSAYRNLVAATVAACFFGSVSNVLIVPLFAVKYSSQLYGLCTGALSFGAIAGSAALSVLNIKKYQLPLFAVSSVFCCAQYLFCPFVSNAAALIVIFAVCGVLTAVYNTLMETVLILSVPENIRGKVSSTVFSTVKVLTPVGILLGGFLGGIVSISVLIPVFILLNMLCKALFILFRKNHTLFAAPAAAE